MPKVILIVDDFLPSDQPSKALPKVTFAEYEGKQAVIIDFGESVSAKSTALFPQFAHLGLNERQRRALSYLQEAKIISNKEYRKINPGINTESARLDLNKMAKLGILEKKGSKKGTLYQLKEESLKKS